MKVIIKNNAKCFQDFRFFRWIDDSNLVFDAEWVNSNNPHWNCIRSGFGASGEYGNGSIFVYEKDGVIIQNN